MPFRNERGAISGAEGCMFFAMFLFAVLLIGLLAVAFFRFREPPQNLPVGGPPPVGLSAIGYRLSVGSLPGQDSGGDPKFVGPIADSR